MNRNKYNPRHYTQIAQKIGDSIRNDLINKHKTSSKISAIDFSSLINSFEYAVPKKGELIKRDAMSNLQCFSKKRKNDQIVGFKEKLKHHLEESRIKKQQRCDRLANMVKQKRTSMEMVRNRKKTQIQNRKRYEVLYLKDVLGQSKQWINRSKEKEKLQYAFKCLQRRANRTVSKNYSASSSKVNFD